MENREQESKQPILLRIADQLVKDQQELDELALEFSLGKAELSGKFEQVKLQMRQDLKAFRQEIADTYHAEKEAWKLEIHEKLDALDSALDKGIAAGSEAFTEQKERIGDLIDDIKDSLGGHFGREKLYYTFKLYGERLKLQMKLLEMNLNSEKKELSNAYRLEMEKARLRLRALKENLKDKKEDLEERFEAFGDEMRQSYEHLKKAIKSL